MAFPDNRARARDGRTEAAQAAANERLKLSDPTAKPTEPKLADLLPRDVEGAWLIPFTRHMAAILDLAARRPEPVVVVDAATVRRVCWTCVRGHSGEVQAYEPAWRQLFDGEADVVHNYVRSLFHHLNNHKVPASEHEGIIAALADRIVALHEAAAEAQVRRLAKRAERNGPVARAQAASAVLEHLAPMQAGLLALGAALADAAGPPESIRAAAVSLQRIEKLCRAELS